MTDHNRLMASVNLRYAHKFFRYDDPSEYLYDLFTWVHAPHGYRYWYNIQTDILPLTDNARAYIEMIIEEKKKINEHNTETDRRLQAMP